MAITESLKRLIESYRLKVMNGEKHIDPVSMVRDRCKYCKRCRGAGCKEVMMDLPEFEKWLRIDRFVGEYMSGIADLAANGRSPDVDWSNELAIKKGMLDLLDDCVNAGAEQEVRFQKLIPVAIAEMAAFDAEDQKTKFTPARDELLLDTYRWLRPRVSSQLAGGNQGSLKGRVFSDSIMGRWTVKFLEGLSRFNQNGRVRRVKWGDTTELVEEPFPSEQLVGNFLNFMGAQGQYTIFERRADVLRYAKVSAYGSESASEIEDDCEQPDAVAHRNFVATSLALAVEALPEPHRTVVRMMDFEGKSEKEVAAHIWPEADPASKVGSVKGYHARAKKMLKSLITIED